MHFINRSLFAGVLYLTLSFWGLGVNSLQASQTANTQHNEIAERDGHGGGGHGGGRGGERGGGWRGEEHGGWRGHEGWRGHDGYGWRGGYYGGYGYYPYDGYYYGGPGYYNGAYEPYYDEGDGVNVYFGF